MVTALVKTNALPRLTFVALPFAAKNLANDDLHFNFSLGRAVVHHPIHSAAECKSLISPSSYCCSHLGNLARFAYKETIYLSIYQILYTTYLFHLLQATAAVILETQIRVKGNQVQVVRDKFCFPFQYLDKMREKTPPRPQKHIC